MTQRPASDDGGSRIDPTPTPEPRPNLEPPATLVLPTVPNPPAATLPAALTLLPAVPGAAAAGSSPAQSSAGSSTGSSAQSSAGSSSGPASFDEMLASGDPDPAFEYHVSALVDGRIPIPVLRHWSDALAAAGMFSEALQAHPAVERADVVRRAELAVLAEQHLTALSLLAELRDARTPRTVHLNHDGQARQAEAESGSPWLALLTNCALVLGGEPGLLPDVLAAARRVQTSAGVAWVVALAAVAAGDLGQAAPAAVTARAGGCRDLRILAISAADRAADGDDWAAIELIRSAQRVALPDENPAGLAVDLLERAGLRDVAQRLSARAATDVSLPVASRAAWQVAARQVGAGHKQIWRRSMTAAGSLLTRRREHAEERRQVASLADLTCRCYGSAGWIGESRMFYVSRHLNEVLPSPVAGLPARLVRCRATKLTFLDFPERQFTLPVVSGVSADVRTDPAADALADPDTRPTPGMGVSLGMVLPA